MSFTEQNKNQMNKDQIQAEALAKVSGEKLAGVNISMGVGKTRLGIKDMMKLYHPGARFLVAAPRLPIKQSWIDELTELGLQDLLEETIVFTTYRSLVKQDFDFDKVYLDECHSLKYSHQPWLLEIVKKGIPVLGLTGTYPNYKRGEKAEMCGKFCPLKYEYVMDEAVDQNILNDYRIYIHPLTLSREMEYPVKDKEGNVMWMSSELKTYNYWCTKLDGASSPKDLQILRVMRMKSLQDFPSKVEYVKELLKQRKHKTIVFANTKAQADEITLNSFHSGNSKTVNEARLARFKKGDLELLSAVEQLSEGVTVPDLKTGIILHTYSNNRKASQKIGRLLRLNPDETATIHIMCYVDTVDKDWVTNALKHLNQDKITWL
jgi:superfamily II DNA or RNA helicase